MTLVALGAKDTWVPRAPFGLSSSDISTTTVVLFDNTDRVAVVFRAPRAGTLDSFEWMCSDESAFASHVIRVSFQDLDASGNPDGTPDQYRTFSQISHLGLWMRPAGPLTSDGTDTGTKRSVTAGQPLAAVVDFSSWTSGLIRFRAREKSLRMADPYVATTGDSGGSWSRGTSMNLGAIALKYTNGYAIGDAWDCPKDIITNTYNVDSNPDEIAMQIILGTEVEVDGYFMFADLDGAAELVMYNSSGGIAIPAVTLSASNRITTGHAGFRVPCAATTLAAGTYYLTLKPTTTTSVTLFGHQYDSGMLAGTPGGTANYLRATRVNGGAWFIWTEDKPLMAFRISKQTSMA